MERLVHGSLEACQIVEGRPRAVGKQIVAPSPSQMRVVTTPKGIQTQLLQCLKHTLSAASWCPHIQNELSEANVDSGKEAHLADHGGHIGSHRQYLWKRREAPCGFAGRSQERLYEPQGDSTHTYSQRQLLLVRPRTPPTHPSKGSCLVPFKKGIPLYTLYKLRPVTSEPFNGG